jgi:Zn-dependent protease with chaperone function
VSLSLAGSIAFNLLFNALAAYWVAAGIAAIASRLCRVRAGRWRQLFLALPLAKVAWDVARGVPAGSFFWLKAVGARQDLGHFRVGVGVRPPFVPVLELALGAMKSGIEYPQSAAELAATGLTRHVGPHAPEAVGVTVIVVAVMLAGLRAVRARVSCREVDRQRRSAEVVERFVLDGRRVDVVVADDYEGVPYLGVTRRPFVCFSRAVYASLTPVERDAVLRHEIGHLANRDRLLFAVLNLFADLFWFVPLLPRRCREIQREAEICADRWAVAHGASRAALASSLVRVASLSRLARAPALGLVRVSLLARRVGELLSDPSRASRTSAALRACAFALTLATVLLSLAFGNH